MKLTTVEITDPEIKRLIAESEFSAIFELIEQVIKEHRNRTGPFVSDGGRLLTSAETLELIRSIAERKFG